MTRLPLRRTLLPAALVVGLLLSAVACGDEDDPGSGPDASASDPPTESPSQSPPESPSEAPSASPTGSPTATATTVAPPSPGSPKGAAMLLTAREMPGVNERTRWQGGATGPEGTNPTGVCQRFDLGTIGASEALVRRFEATGTPVTAVQVVGTFADEESARRALEVLKSWRAECRAQLQDDVKKISGLTPVTVPGGDGGHYLVQHGADGAELHEFDGVALVRVGPRVSIVQIDTMGQDYNYPPGQEPAALAAKAAAAKLT